MEKFNKLTQIQKIMVLASILVFLVLAYNVFRIISYNMSKKEINYTNFDLEKQIAILDKEDSRAIYYSLEDAIKKYLNSYKDVNKQVGIKSDEEFASYKDFYNILISEYKKYLTQAQYENIAKTFLEKFAITVEIEPGVSEYGSVDTKNIIKNIYVFDTNRYICEVSSDNIKKTGYIGIELNPSNSRWYIFYIG